MPFNERNLIPAVEVHLTDANAREEFRHISYVRVACETTITGHGFAGYREAMAYLKEHHGRAEN